jgi:hypothetical protein
MSSSSPLANGHAPAIASSSRTSPTPEADEDDGLEIQPDELLAEEDPLHDGNGGLNDGYVALHYTLLYIC